MTIDAPRASEPLESVAAWARFTQGTRCEFLGGRVVYYGRPGPLHGLAQGNLFGWLREHGANRNQGDKPAGWWLSMEVDLELLEQGCRPDLVGWRRDRSPALPRPDARGLVSLVPDWVCEVLSPGTARFDMGAKRTIYHRAGVPNYWMLDPTNRALLLLEREARDYVLVAAVGPGEPGRFAPFEEALLDVADLLPPEEPPPR